MLVRLSERRSRRWGFLPCMLLLAVGCAEATDEVFFVVDAEAIEEVNVIAKDATVELNGGDFEDEIRVIATRSYSVTAPRIAVDTIDGQLRVTHRCPRQRTCSVDYVIVMPRVLDAAVVSEAGSVLAAQLAGNLDVTTVFGDVYGGALRSSEVNISSEFGEVTLSFDTPPERVRVNTIEGNTSISVPRDESYSIELETARGDSSLANLENDPEATRSIAVSSDRGDIAVTGVAPMELDEEDADEEDADEDLEDEDQS